MADRLKGKLMAAAVIFLILFVALALFVIIPRMYNLSVSLDFQEDTEAGHDNPLTGYAPWGDDEKLAQDSRLVYMDVTWAEWEPREGEYDIKSLEDRYHIRRWKEEGKHAVLRFVCDKPGEEEHMDIPGWLYEQTGDGVFYDLDYGKGYAPDYENETFRGAHERALKALGDYCNQDTFVAYVELGSLGHWGEWHTQHEEGVPPMPDAEICWEYANHYADSFYNARLMMRRNYIMAVDGNMGLYNDMTGDEEDTLEWLDWQENGGAYELPKGEISYKEAAEQWKKAPIGGEFTPSGSMEEMLGSSLAKTRELIDASHMTFIGPNTPLEYDVDLAAAKAVENSLGYRYWISHMDVDMDYAGNEFQVKLTWENSGSAPIYFQWMPMMYVYDEEGKLKYWEEIPLDLTELTPGEQLQSVNHFPFNDMFREGYSIGIGISDPLTEEPEIELCMNKQYNNGINMIYAYDGTNGTTFGQEE